MNPDLAAQPTLLPLGLDPRSSVERNVSQRAVPGTARGASSASGRGAICFVDGHLPPAGSQTFPSTGTAIEPRNFSRSFDRCLAKAQVPRITVHGTRKTCGSLLAALDVHPRVAMQILRHSKIAVTMEIYTEVPSAATRDALRRLSQWLDS